MALQLYRGVQAAVETHRGNMQHFKVAVEAYLRLMQQRAELVERHGKLGWMEGFPTHTTLAAVGEDSGPTINMTCAHMGPSSSIQTYQHINQQDLAAGMPWLTQLLPPCLSMACSSQACEASQWHWALVLHEELYSLTQVLMTEISSRAQKLACTDVQVLWPSIDVCCPFITFT